MGSGMHMCTPLFLLGAIAWELQISRLAVEQQQQMLDFLHTLGNLFAGDLIVPLEFVCDGFELRSSSGEFGAEPVAQLIDFLGLADRWGSSRGSSRVPLPQLRADPIRVGTVLFFLCRFNKSGLSDLGFSAGSSDESLFRNELTLVRISFT
jgi:hypothetical protein